MSPHDKVNGVNQPMGYVQYEGGQQAAHPGGHSEKGWASFEDDSEGTPSAVHAAF
jgi:hypothetical protein